MLKELQEKRNAMLDELDKILDGAKTEKRAFNEEEIRKVAELKTEIGNIDQTIKLEEEVRGFEKIEVKAPKTEEEKRAAETAKEERAFADFIKGDTRALQASGNGGVVIPLSIANRIIDTVKNMSPVLSKATIWDVKGDLSIPAYDYTQHLPSGYYTELSTITAQAGSFTSIKLANVIVVSLATISKSLINRADIDVVPFVVNEVAKAIALFLEKELLNNANSSIGSGATKLGGLANASQSTTSTTTLVPSAQDLINVQLSVPQVYQDNCAWIMSPAMLGQIQGLTAGAGNNLLLMGNSLSEDGPMRLLGKPVYVSDQMPAVAVGAPMAYYGDFSGLHVKMTKNVELQVLNERFADIYAVGVLASVELDSAIVEPRKISKYISK